LSIVVILWLSSTHEDKDFWAHLSILPYLCHFKEQDNEKFLVALEIFPSLWLLEIIGEKILFFTKTGDST